MGEISVYWTPGCSSCVKVKEFLTRKGVAFESINVAADPSEMEFLASLGVWTVPVVVRRRDFVFGRSLEDVASFVGVNDRAESLPPDVLMERCALIESTIGKRRQAEVSKDSCDEITPQMMKAGYDALRPWLDDIPSYLVEQAVEEVFEAMQSASPKMRNGAS